MTITHVDGMMEEYTRETELLHSTTTFLLRRDWERGDMDRKRDKKLRRGLPQPPIHDGYMMGAMAPPMGFGGAFPPMGGIPFYPM